MTEMIESAANRGALTAERPDFVRQQIESTYESLLLNGGMIAQDGTIIAHTYNDVKVENMTPELFANLSMQSVVKLRRIQVDDLLPEGRNPHKSRVYLIRPGTLRKITYRPRKRTDWFYVHGVDEKGVEHEYSMSADSELVGALKNYAGKILEKEGLREPEFPLTSYTDSILREIVDEQTVARAK